MCMHTSYKKNGVIIDRDIVIIDKTDPAEPTVRKMYWINRLKTRYPLGLNMDNELESEMHD